MIYPRLKIAKDLLAEDGVIFISIDDNEVHNLRKICDEIFNEINLIAEFAVASNSTKNNSKHVSVSHEYILCYARNKSSLTEEWKVKKNNVDEYYSRAMTLVRSGLSQEQIHQELLALVKYPRFYDLDHYTYADSRGIYQTDNPGGVSNGNTQSIVYHPVTKKPCPIPNGGWRYKNTEIERLVKEDLFAFGEDETIIPRVKRYLGDYIYQVPKSVLFFDSQGSTKWLKNNGLPFDFSKAIELMKYIISIAPKDALILDFFSGSATTAHAVMQLNAEDGGNRKFIMVQLPEKCDEKSEAYKAGYKTICDIGQERIRRAGKKIVNDLKVCGQERKIEGYTLLRSGSGGSYRRAEWKNNETGEIKTESRDVHEPNDFYKYYPNELDIGFRVLKLDSSNMQEVYYNPSAMTQDILAMTVDNVKADRTPLDLLFQVMLDLGVELSAKIEEHIVSGKTYYTVNGNDIIACFDDNIDNNVIVAIAKQNPLYAVFKDKSFATDSVGINNEQLFKTYSPSTVVKVI